MLRQCTIVLASFVGLVVFGFARADATPMKITGVTATSSTFLTTGFDASYAVNYTAGFNDTLHQVTTTSEGGTFWLNAGPAADPNPWIKFDLGTSQPIGDMWLFNYNGSGAAKTGRGFETADIRYSTNGADWTLLKNQTFARAPGTAPYSTPNVVTIGVTARYVWLNNAVNFADADADYTGISKVEFYEGVPEPSTVVLLVTGLIGLLCYAWRKRR